MKGFWGFGEYLFASSLAVDAKIFAIIYWTLKHLR